MQILNNEPLSTSPLCLWRKRAGGKGKNGINDGFWCGLHPTKPWNARPKINLLLLVSKRAADLQAPMHLRSRCADTIFFETHVTRINEALVCRQGMMPEICHHLAHKQNLPCRNVALITHCRWCESALITFMFTSQAVSTYFTQSGLGARAQEGERGGRKSLRIKVFSDLLVTVICLSHAFKSAAFNVQLRVSHGRKDRVMETGGCFYTSFGGPAALLPRKLTQRCLARYSPELVEASTGSLFLP